MSTQSLWRHLINPFESATSGSNVKMLSIGTDTHAKPKNRETNVAIAGVLLVN